MNTSTESEFSDWIFGAIVTVLIVACFAWIHGLSNAPAQAVGSVIPTRSDAQLPGSKFPSSPRIVSTPAAPQGGSIAEVYECEKDGQRILSDQLCGPSANVVKIMAPNRMDAQETSGLYRGSYTSTPRFVSRPHRANYGGESNICQSIEARIDAINARMRQAYTSQEGEQLRRRLRQLSDERHDARCIR
jgi:hypothetical protein